MIKTISNEDTRNKVCCKDCKLWSYLRKETAFDDWGDIGSCSLDEDEYNEMHGNHSGYCLGFQPKNTKEEAHYCRECHHYDSKKINCKIEEKLGKAIFFYKIICPNFKRPDNNELKEE